MSEQELGIKLQNMFKSIYEAADIKYIRPIKRDMFRCLNDCLDDKNTTKQVEKCSDVCGATVQKAMHIVQEEINGFQGRIDRCLMDCQDDVRNERDENKARLQFEGCANKCLNQFVPMVPEVTKSLCDRLDKIKKERNIR